MKATAFVASFLALLSSLAPRAIAAQDVPYEKIMSEVDSYLVVGLQREFPSPESYFRLPARYPHDLDGEFMAAGQYLFRRDRIEKAIGPFPTQAFLDVIKTYDRSAEFPPLRCPWNPVLGVVLLDPEQRISGIIILGTCYNSLSFETPEGTSVEFRFPGLHSKAIDPLVQLLRPGYHYLTQ